VTFRLDDIDAIRLKLISKRRKVSQGELVRQAVKKRRARLAAEAEARK
jgi:hypothetical protein